MNKVIQDFKCKCGFSPTIKQTAEVGTIVTFNDSIKSVFIKDNNGNIINSFKVECLNCGLTSSEESSMENAISIWK